VTGLADRRLGSVKVRSVKVGRRDAAAGVDESVNEFVTLEYL
jgi:hypothetical protein